MEYDGRISRVLPVRSGTSQKGEWKVLPFVFEYFETEDQRWPDRVKLDTMDANTMAQIGAYLKKDTDGKVVVENGEYVLMYELKCRVGWSHNVRDYERQDGTKDTTNNLRLYKFEIAGQQGQQHGQQTQHSPIPATPPTAENPFPPQQTTGSAQYDDLPF